VAVACVGKAAEPKGVRRRITFPTKNRAKCTCWPYWRSNCEICTCHCQGSERSGNLGGKGGDFWDGRYHPFCHLSPASLCQGGCDRRIVAVLSVP
jgi:hypothetical protein